MAGNLVSNMGADLPERIGCASRVEELERLNRSNANVYVHSILALPAQLSPEGRAAVLAEICGHYDRLRLPHAAALHKPSPNNSQLNYHAHILVSLRPMERDGDVLNFAPRKLTWLNTTAGLALQRRLIAAVFNRALEAEQAKSRYTHRSRISDGLPPGGFTKWAGVRMGPEDAGALGQFVETEAEAQEAQTLDEALKDFIEVIGVLERAEAKHEQLTLRETAREKTTARYVDAGDSPEGRDTVVANSQRSAAEGNIGRELQRSAKGEEVEKAEAESARISNDSNPAELPFEELLKLQMLQLRKKWERRSPIPLADGSSRLPASVIASIEAYYLDRSVVLSVDDQRLSYSAKMASLGDFIRQVANTQQGYELLQDIVSAVPSPSPHFGSPIEITSPGHAYQELFDRAALAKKKSKNTEKEG